MDGLGDGDGMGFDMQPMMMNQQSQLYGGYPHDGSQMSVPGSSMYPDDSVLGGDDGNDANDAKRRRIARVRSLLTLDYILGPQKADSIPHLRHATCAEKRRSSATGRCPSAHTASTIRPTVSSHK